MNRKIKTVTLLIPMIFALSGIVFGQEKVLAPGDVGKFISTCPAVISELESLDPSRFGGGGIFAITDAGEATQEVFSILAKHGWDENYFIKVAVIARIYATMKLEQEFIDANPDIKQALAELDNNSYLTPGMRKQMKEQILAAFTMSQEYLQASQGEMNPRDVEQVEAYFSQLDILFENSDL